MRALIRNEDEVYLEDDWNEFTRNHLDWMIGEEKDADGNRIPGDGWTLVENYTADGDDDGQETEPGEELIIIDGKSYTKAELRALLGE